MQAVRGKRWAEIIVIVMSERVLLANDLRRGFFASRARFYDDLRRGFGREQSSLLRKIKNVARERPPTRVVLQFEGVAQIHAAYVGVFQNGCGSTLCEYAAGIQDVGAVADT